MATVAFVVPGKPETNHRARVTRNGTYHAKEYVAYKRAVQIVAKAACPIDWALDRNYDVSIVMHEPDRRRRDVDNAAKGLLDGCRGVLWADDRQIDRLTVERGEVDKVMPRVVVRVSEVSPVDIAARRLEAEILMMRELNELLTHVDGDVRFELASERIRTWLNEAELSWTSQRD